LARACPAGFVELPRQVVDLLTQPLDFSAQDLSLAFRSLRAFT
jgi:hypothetical protein